MPRSAARAPRAACVPACGTRGALLDGSRQAPAVGVAAHPVDDLELLERATRAHRDAGERRLGEVGGHLALVAEPLVEALKERAPAGQRDSAVHDVPGQLRRRAVERLLDRADDLAD